MTKSQIDSDFIISLRDYFQNFESMKLSERKCAYQIQNQFLKNNSIYRHSKYIKDLIKVILTNKNFMENENLTNPNIKRLIYKTSLEDYVNSYFQFKNFLKKNEKLFLIEFQFCTRRDLTVSDIARRINRLKDEELMKYTFIYHIDHFCENNISTMLCKNTTQVAYGHRIYQFMIIDENGKKEYSDPFSLVCFKQLFKRCDKSILGKQYEKYLNKESNDLLYYLKSIYETKNNSYRNYFRFPLNFYTC